MTDKVFAPSYSTNSDGWYLFPPDAKMREQYFDHEAMEHPAKFNLHMMMACVEYVSEPGEVLMDIFGGTGSLMLAANLGRYVTLLDIEDAYTKLQQKSKDKFVAADPALEHTITLVTGSNLKLMPIPCHHIITSPPYAGIMKRKSKTGIGFSEADMAGDTKLWRALGDKLLQYSLSPDNIGNLNEFYYAQTMERVYKKSFASILPGGTLTVVIKDHIRDGERVYFSKWVWQRCLAYGFEPMNWYKWKAPGSPFLQIKRAQGFETVGDEDIMIFRRP